MRLFLFLPLFAACAAEVSDPETPASVRDYLERGDVDLAVSAPDSAGAITAARKTGDGWVPGLTDLAIEGGSVTVSADGDGTLTISDLAIDVGPIVIPASVLGYEVELTDIHVGQVSPFKAVPAWTDDNEAHASTSVDLSLAWSLTNHGTTSPLGAPDLPPVPVVIDLTGDGRGVHAELRVQAPGTLWSWANLIELGDLTLILVAETP